jgi:hypothetical protein
LREAFSKRAVAFMAYPLGRLGFIQRSDWPCSTRRGNRQRSKRAIGHAALDMAIANDPRERFTLRNGALVILEHKLKWEPPEAQDRG